jgi:DNA-directed RNA polymerase specialized sigma24 family protein
MVPSNAGLRPASAMVNHHNHSFLDDDTGIGGPRSRFPLTQRSLVAGASSDDPRVRELAYEAIIRNYWKPAYKYIRIKWQQSNEDAKDLTQSFFATSLEKEFFRSYDHSKASFRTFLRICLDSFVANERKAGTRLKRGGMVGFVSLDFEEAESELALNTLADDLSMEDYFRNEWIRGLFTFAVEQLKQQLDAAGKPVHFALFELYDLDHDAEDALSYAALAERFGLPVTSVTNYLAAARREFRRIVLEKLKEVTVTEDEFRSEARLLLGVEVH